MTSEGSYAVTGSYDSTLKVWDLTSIGTLKINIIDHPAWSTDIAISRDSRHTLHSKTIIIAEPFQARFLSEILYFDTQTQKPEIFATVDGDIVNALSITDDGQAAVLGGGLTDDKVYFGMQYQPLNKLLIPDRLNRMQSISFNERLIIWDLETMKTRSLKGRAGMILALAVTADGKYNVSGSDNCTLKLWSVKGRRLLYTMEGHEAPIRAVAVTPDGKYAVSGSDDRTLKLWELKTGNIARTLTGHQSTVTEVLITPDGRFILSASLDMTLRLWDFASDMCLAKFNHDIPLYCCALADNDIIALGDENGAANIVMLAR